MSNVISLHEYNQFEVLLDEVQLKIFVCHTPIGWEGEDRDIDSEVCFLLELLAKCVSELGVKAIIKNTDLILTTKLTT